MIGPTQKRHILKIGTQDAIQDIEDYLAVEEPLQILLTAPLHSPPITRKNISITMRTPGDDKALAAGFLYSEGILDINNRISVEQEDLNQIVVNVLDKPSGDLNQLERHFYATSSCGVCGKASLEAVRSICMPDWPVPKMKISKTTVLSLTEKMKEVQSTFQSTGGLHAVALFDMKGRLLDIKEDVGRHNAMDKLIGTVLLHNNTKELLLPLNKHLLLLSGRASFELIQKAVMAGIKFVMAVGAPSSMAVDLAEDHDITLIGFLRDDKFNVYTGQERLSLP